MRRRGRAAAAAALCAGLGWGCAAGAAPDAVVAGLATVRLGETAHLGALRVTPQALVEDSRCPADVVCVQAGTVRVRARVAAGRSASTQVLTLGRNVQAGGRWVGLPGACPYPRATQPRAAADYRFVIAVAATDTPPPSNRDLCLTGA